jgi:hypothetical protein
MSKRLIEHKQIRFHACRNHPHSRLYPARASNGERQDVELVERLKEEDRDAFCSAATAPARKPPPMQAWKSGAK